MASLERKGTETPPFKLRRFDHDTVELPSRESQRSGVPSSSRSHSPVMSPANLEQPDEQSERRHSSFYSHHGSKSPSRSPRSRNSSRSRSHSRQRPPRDRSASVLRSNSQSLSLSLSLSRSRSRSRLGSGSRSRSHSHRSGVYSRSQSRSSSRRSYYPHSRSPRSRSFSSRSRSSSRSRYGAPVLPNFAPCLSLHGHMRAVSQVRLSPDGRWIASASADGTAKIWDADTGEHMQTLVGHLAGINTIAWAPDSMVVATGSDDKIIRCWDRRTGLPAHATSRPFIGHHNYIYCLAFSPKGNVLASGSYDEAVFLWDVRQGRLLRDLPAHSDPVTGLDFSPDGTLIVSCSTDGLTRLWDTSTGQCLRTLVHEDNPSISSVCFSPNGRYILASSLDSCIRLWDYIEGRGTVKRTYQGHLSKGFVVGACFYIAGDEGLSPFYDGRGYEDSDNEAGFIMSSRSSASYVVSASEDGDVFIWDVKSKKVVQRIIKAHEGVCFWVDVQGDTLVTAGQDNSVKVFRNMNAQSKKALTRDNTNEEKPWFEPDLSLHEGDAYVGKEARSPGSHAFDPVDHMIEDRDKSNPD